MTLFEAVTTDEETLAANIVSTCHASIRAWEAAHGRKPPQLNFAADWARTIKALHGEAKQKGEIVVEQDITIRKTEVDP